MNSVNRERDILVDKGESGQLLSALYVRVFTHMVV